MMAWIKVNDEKKTIYKYAIYNGPRLDVIHPYKEYLKKQHLRIVAGCS